MEVDESLGINTIDRISDLTGANDHDFVETSQTLAGLFHNAHAGRSVVPGIIFFIHGTVAEGSAAGVVIKADFHEAMQPGDDGLRLLHELVLSSNSKFCKMAGVVDGDERSIAIRDEQSSRIDSPAASFFYSSFLGTKFAPSGPFVTKAVYDAAKRAAAAIADSPEELMRVTNGINSMFFDERLPTMHPDDISDRFFDKPADKDRFNEIMMASRLPMEAFVKDTSRLSHAIQTSRLDLDNGVRSLFLE